MLKKTVLSQNDWLECAINRLRNCSVDKITVVALANELGVTRGSFYHHFVDRRELLSAMLIYWERQWTERVTSEVSKLNSDPAKALLAIIRWIRSHGGGKYDRAIRTWALHDEEAMAVVKRVDDFRLGFIKALFNYAGFKGIDAENRARLLLYYEVCEPAMFANQTKKMKEALVWERHRFLTKATLSAEN